MIAHKACHCFQKTQEDFPSKQINHGSKNNTGQNYPLFLKDLSLKRKYLRYYCSRQ
jgi:hypothetical protein